MIAIRTIKTSWPGISRAQQLVQFDSYNEERNC